MDSNWFAGYLGVTTSYGQNEPWREVTIPPVEQLRRSVAQENLIRVVADTISDPEEFHNLKRGQQTMARQRDNSHE